MTNSNKAIILAVAHGYRGGWHQPDSEVFKDEEFWRAVSKGLEYREWRTLYEKYLVADSNEITDEAFWKAEFTMKNYNSLGFLKGTRAQDTILWIIFNLFLYHWILTKLI